MSKSQGGSAATGQLSSPTDMHYDELAKATADLLITAVCSALTSRSTEIPVLLGQRMGISPEAGWWPAEPVDNLNASYVPVPEPVADQPGNGSEHDPSAS